jgi:hypothetical protein
MNASGAALPDRDWKRAFDEPIQLPDGGELRTVLDAGRYVAAFPDGKNEREEWQAVREVLLTTDEGHEQMRR